MALLRGINVGGKRTVSMSALKAALEAAGLTDVKTHINSGNVMFTSRSASKRVLTAMVERAIEADLSLAVSVLILDINDMASIVKALPPNWANNDLMKTDVMFLWPDIDRPGIVEELPTDPDLEDVKYTSGVVFWRIDRDKASRSRMSRLVGTALYKKMTVRNVNTTRKLFEMMQQINGAEDRPKGR